MSCVLGGTVSAAPPLSLAYLTAIYSGTCTAGSTTAPATVEVMGPVVTGVGGDVGAGVLTVSS